MKRLLSNLKFQISNLFFRREPEAFHHAEPGWWRVEITEKNRLITRIKSHE